MKNKRYFKPALTFLLAIILCIVLKYNIYAQDIVGFDFDAAGHQTGEKLEAYGDKNGYASTSGNGILYCYMGTDAVRALEWSDPEYIDGAYNITPIVRASEKNKWGDNPSFVIECSTKGMYEVKFSASLGGSSNGPSHFKLQYSTDGATFKEIDKTNIAIEFDSRKQVKNYYADTAIPDEGWNQQKLFIRIITSDTITVAGGNYKMMPSGGEIAVNHLKLTGDTEKKTEPVTNVTEPVTTSGVSETTQNTYENHTTNKTPDNNIKETTAKTNSETIADEGHQSGKTQENVVNKGNSDNVKEFVTEVVVNPDGSTETVVIENNTSETTGSGTTTVSDNKETDNKDKKKTKSKENKTKKAKNKMSQSQIDKNTTTKESGYTTIILIILSVILVAGIAVTALINLKRKE